jgi:hypothetical protein
VPADALDSLRDRVRRATEPGVRPPTQAAAEPAAEEATQPDGFHPFFRRLAAELDQSQLALEERSRDLAETREALAEQKGIVAGLQEAVRVAETAAGETARQISISIERAERAEAELARLRARGLWARLLNRS